VNALASRRNSSRPSRHPRSLPLLPPSTLVGLVIACVAALVIAFVSMQSSQSRVASVREITSALEKVGELQNLMSIVQGAETGQRGYLLSGDESYLEPYRSARRRWEASVQRLRTLVSDDAEQRERVQQMAQLTASKFALIEQMIGLRRAGKVEESLAIVRSDQPRVMMDRLKAAADDFERVERTRFEHRRDLWESEARYQMLVTWGGTALLLLLIVAAGAMASRDYRTRARAAWLGAGESLLAVRIQGEQSARKLGEEILSFLSEYLDAKVGAVYVHGDDGLYRRVAGHALDPETPAPPVRVGETLVGQAAKERHSIRVKDVPENYLPVVSGVGRGTPRELILAPAVVDDEVQAVIELGLLREAHEADLDLLDRVAEMLAIATRSARDRERRQALLEETQRQAEELQAQQEELRVSNEELEEQGRALRESQARLETQHAELEQTNVQLEERTQQLERQKAELVLAQSALQESARTLERTSRYKSEFLANMSHELRTPLNSALILSKLLADNGQGNLDEEQVRYARTIHSSNNELLTLINDILDLSKIEAGQVEIVPEPVQVAELVDSLTATFEPVSKDRGLQFHVDVAKDAPATITTDSGRLLQVLKNLLSNAFKFTPKGEVALQISPRGSDRVLFAVRDTGIGIPPTQQEIIFEAFRQADGTTSRQYGGTGLGLSISRELATRLGGSVRLQSTPGLGSTFTLEVPVHLEKPKPRAREEGAPAPRVEKPSPPRAPAAPAPTQAAQPMPPGPHIADDRAERKHGERLILVVEDDERFARVLYDLAHELGFDCVHASRAGEAIELARRLKPCGILLDVKLPDDSGLSLLERIKRDPQVRHIPVHMMSVEDHAQAALGMGAVGYVLKPVARDELIKAIGRLEERLSKRVSRVLVVEDDERLRGNIALLLKADQVEITAVGTVAEALARVQAQSFDCLVTDLQLPDASGYDLLENLSKDPRFSRLPVIVYTGRALSREEETRLRRFSKSIIIKGARSPERLLDEVTLFLHSVESALPPDQQSMLRRARQRDESFEGRHILLAEDDVRNIFALSRVFEPLGAVMEIARNGQEAVDHAQKGGIDLVLMDIMMPVKDGLTAMREIRAKPAFADLPIIAITAKAMADDRRQCLEAGANDYIAKPIDIDRLVSLCRVWLAK
jgi:signal transduction histidine kinase/DNA-binding response OmpR family regulator/CHASE3 domain sensor protein